MTSKLFRDHIRRAEMCKYWISNTRGLIVKTPSSFMTNIAFHLSEVDKVKAGSQDTCNLRQ